MTEINRNVDGFGPGDMSRPIVLLIQGTTQNKPDGSNPGQFYNNMSNELYPDGFDMIILDFYKTRTYWGRDVIGDEPPECSCNNIDSGESVDGKKCSECDKRLDSAWAVDAQKRRQYCTIQYSILGMMVDDFMPFLLRASGISTGAVQKLLSRINFNKELRNPETGKIEWHKFKVAVRSKEEKHPMGSAWALDFGEITPFGDDKFEKLTLQMTAGYLGQSNALPAPAASSGAEASGKPEAAIEKPPATQAASPVVKTTPTIRVVGKEPVDKTPPSESPATKKTPPAPKKTVSLDI
jgi:hypothetical protein